MRSLTEGLIGVIARPGYRIEVWNMSAPKLALTNERWIYITKKHHNGDIGERSIGLPESDLAKLIELIGLATRYRKENKHDHEEDKSGSEAARKNRQGKG